MAALSEKEKNRKYRESKVLLIDENTQERNNIASRLRMQGISVDSMSSGFQAINQIEHTQYDLIIVMRTLQDMIESEIITLIKSPLNESISTAAMIEDVEPTTLPNQDNKLEAIKVISQKSRTPKVICCIDKLDSKYVDEIAMAGADCLYQSRYNFNEILKAIDKILF
ncbi:MAG: hypothetical protein A2504_03355 [Bdellovibrionales bacterium RIFOXYD12_FULL_39_22]|nr:MAG: hypothetical protein A2385_15765 [Bdellovibrionales bacterium RIFOXYB1_FULL_39_21]OFZ41561.1 MAG: hypothetical protein A2485_02455 [Bdellovibrionales bacterium RIFOXYC12_FULL_39_17]OFZ45874.1 MAG: hypothetical protein A2404_12820 [Bdellovibrionales bacterium RIFOXYC1_FULL_39_130]OFZ71937.1 MAG: hypothetical protein A2451_04230 [Bdellovibrionales bacterium RIFOXYC2_FULL_39_8]OFZ74806.1 MAG: hypothetical protein A2560_10250 [Bdellovibrionales bacterium RIFOXYD1_FULL_39_84]OFZ92666.1 MAG: